MAVLNELQLETYSQYHTGRSIAEISRHVKRYSLPIPFVSLLSFLESIYSVVRVKQYTSNINFIFEYLFIKFLHSLKV